MRLRTVRRRIALPRLPIRPVQPILPGRRGWLHQRIGQLAAWTNVDQPPFFLARHRIFIAAAQKAHVPRGFQIVEILRVGVIFPVKELDGALVLQPASYQLVFSLALRFERHPRHFHVQRDGDGRRQHEY